MKYKGIIFDLDGVLCSTDRFHFQAWQETARQARAPFDETINQRLRGVSRMESLKIILEGSPLTFTREEKERMAREKNERYRHLLQQMTPADMPDGVRRALESLRAAGLKLAVGSSSKNAHFILERLDAEQYFDAVCDGTQIVHSKPHPEVFLKAAEMLGLPPAACLVVEDAPAGLQAARAAGMDCAGVGDAPWPFAPTYRLPDVTALPAALPG
ncbi:MAG TPA: beta-phosphoglucomutase [Candidatus Fournierella merdavium]|uniref:beta-phosphoglucomutase n=1 Tax=Candidatus Allofournierella merdavium TaxID=2838593 RepID=UPI001F880343|nr:beta-phosphoglucomutase [Candidatus Fournierella merdavium]